MYRFSRHFISIAAAATLGLFATSVASAQASSAVPDRSAATPASSSDAPILFDVAPIGEGALAAVSGRADRPIWQTATSSSNATVNGNKVGDNSPTGALSVSDSAFQNVSGISMVNLNTGNASSINAALNVNLTINQAPAGM